MVFQNYWLTCLEELEQESTVDAFYRGFEALRSFIEYTEPNISEWYYTSLFLNGLPTEVQAYVEGFSPVTVLDAYCLASIYANGYSRSFPQNQAKVASVTTDDHGAATDLSTQAISVMEESISDTNDNGTAADLSTQIIPVIDPQVVQEGRCEVQPEYVIPDTVLPVVVNIHHYKITNSDVAQSRADNVLHVTDNEYNEAVSKGEVAIPSVVVISKTSEMSPFAWESSASVSASVPLGTDNVKDLCVRDTVNDFIHVDTVLAGYRGFTDIKDYVRVTPYIVHDKVVLHNCSPMMVKANMFATEVPRLIGISVSSDQRTDSSHQWYVGFCFDPGTTRRNASTDFVRCSQEQSSLIITPSRNVLCGSSNNIQHCIQIGSRDYGIQLMVGKSSNNFRDKGDTVSAGEFLLYERLAPSVPGNSLLLACRLGSSPSQDLKQVLAVDRLGRTHIVGIVCGNTFTSDISTEVEHICFDPGIKKVSCLHQILEYDDVFTMTSRPPCCCALLRFFCIPGVLNHIDVLMTVGSPGVYDKSAVVVFNFIDDIRVQITKTETNAMLLMGKPIHNLMASSAKQGCYAPVVGSLSDTLCDNKVVTVCISMANSENIVSHNSFGAMDPVAPKGYVGLLGNAFAYNPWASDLCFSNSMDFCSLGSSGWPPPAIVSNSLFQSDMKARLHLLMALQKCSLRWPSDCAKKATALVHLVIQLVFSHRHWNKAARTFMIHLCFIVWRSNLLKASTYDTDAAAYDDPGSNCISFPHSGRDVVSVKGNKAAWDNLVSVRNFQSLHVLVCLSVSQLGQLFVRFVDCLELRHSSSCTFAIEDCILCFDPGIMVSWTMEDSQSIIVSVVFSFAAVQHENLMQFVPDQRTATLCTALPMLPVYIYSATRLWLIAWGIRTDSAAVIAAC